MLLPFNTIDQLPDVKGKRVLVRVDFNAPIRDGVVVNDFKIRRTLPLLQTLQKKGARLTLVSHLSGDTGRSLMPVVKYLESIFPVTLLPLSSDRGAALQEGRVVLLENIRQDAGETANSRALAETLAEGVDLYVNEAFSASHREHASIVGVPELVPAYAGRLFSEEYVQLKKAENPDHPFVVISAGAKFNTKIPLVNAFLDSAETVFVGGALANTFFKARGYDVGASLASEGDVGKHPVLLDERVVLPVDVEVENEGRVSVVSPEEVGPGDSILDAGPKTMRYLKDVVMSARTVLWNGPLGNYERGFNRRSTELAEALAESDAFSVVGGGDTVIAITQAGLEDDISFVSTAGGAMITFLAEGTLPGIEALKRGMHNT